MARTDSDPARMLYMDRVILTLGGIVAVIIYLLIDWGLLW